MCVERKKNDNEVNALPFRLVLVKKSKWSEQNLDGFFFHREPQ